jgi:hypothetical protein
MELAHHHLPCLPWPSFFQGALELIEECCNQIPKGFKKNKCDPRENLEAITTSAFLVIWFW